MAGATVLRVLAFCALVATCTGYMSVSRADTLFYLRIHGGLTTPMSNMLESFSNTLTSTRMLFLGSNFVDTEFAKPNMPTLLKQYQNNVMEYFTGTTISSFIESGLLRRLDHVYQKEGWFDKIPQSLADTCKHPKIPGYYCVPYNTYTWAMYYRPSVFARLGLQPPNTWEEMMSVFEKLKAAGIQPMQYPVKSGWYSGAWIDYLNMRINGVKFHRNLTQGGAPYGGTEVRKVLDFWRDLTTSGAMEVIDGDWSNVADGIRAGTVGVYLIGDFVRWGNPSDTDWDFFRFPVIDQSLEIGEDAPCDSYLIPAGTQAGAPTTPEDIGGKAELLLGKLMSTDFMQSNLNMYAIPANVQALSASSNPIIAKSVKLLKESHTVFQFFDRDCPRAFALRAVASLTKFVNGSDIDEITAQMDADRMDVYFGLVSAPVANPSGGTFQNIAHVRLSTLTVGASVYYTTDGSTPTLYSLLFNESQGPIVFSDAGTFTIKAFASRSGLDPSPLMTAVITVEKSEDGNMITIIMSAVAGVVFIVLLVMAWKGTADYRRMRKLLSAVSLAENTAESVAEMDFDNVQYLYDIENPSRLQEAFIKIVHNLEMYKSFLPAGLLARLQTDPVMSDVRNVTPPGLASHSAAIVFTDIRRSTSIWEAVPEAMKKAMRVHNTTMREVIKEYGGYEIKTIGDAFMVAFESAAKAISFGLCAQERLAAASWPPELLDVPICDKQYDSHDRRMLWCGLSIRIGVNFGDLTIEESVLTGRADYFGHTVNVAARLESTGTVGAVTVTSDVWNSVKAELQAQGVVASEPLKVVLAGVQDPVQIQGLWPKSLAGRHQTPLSGSTVVFIRESVDSQGSMSTRSMRTKAKANVPKNNISADLGEVVSTTIGTIEVRTDEVAQQTRSPVGAQLSGGVIHVLQTAERCSAMLLAVVGNRVCMGWDLARRNLSHTENSLRFGAMMRESTCVQAVGLVSGIVWHGSIGSTQRFVTATGKPVAGSAELCTVSALHGKRCLFAAVDTSPDQLPASIRQQLRKTAYELTSVAGEVYEVAGLASYDTWPDSFEKDAVDGFE